jgi:hypothetical protein
MADLFEKEKNDPAMIAYLKALGIDPVCSVFFPFIC